jgi:hypothetical protein
MRDQPEPQNTGKERDRTMSILRVLEEQWEIMEANMTYIEKHEEWMSATWLETSSLEEQRLRLRRQDNSRGGKSGTEEGNKKSTGDDASKMYQSSLKDGLFRREGASRDEPMGVWEFWESKIDDDKEVRAENPRKRDAEKIASQVEENLTVGKLTVGTPMFGRRGSFYQDDLGRMKPRDIEEEKKKKKNLTTPCSGKIRGEIHPTAERKDASLIKSVLLRHERSPMGGRVMKMRKGTPTKMQKVKSWRNLFENTSSPTEQVAELLLQSSGVNPFNLSTRLVLGRRGDWTCSQTVIGLTSAAWSLWEQSGERYQERSRMG